MKHVIYIKFIVIIFVLLFFIIKSAPLSLSATGLDDVISSGDSFLSASSSEDVEKKLPSDKMVDVSNTIYNILLGTGIIIAVIIGTILGVQFMISSAEEKAQIKESIIPFLLGCILIFGAFLIWKAFILAFK